MCQCSETVGVICVFQKLAAECQSAGYSGTLIPYKCDLSNEEEILSMFSAIKTLHKGVDVCINNAGLAHSEPLLSGRTEGWRNMIDVSGSLTVILIQVRLRVHLLRKGKIIASPNVILTLITPLRE